LFSLRWNKASTMVVDIMVMDRDMRLMGMLQLHKILLLCTMEAMQDMVVTPKSNSHHNHNLSSIRYDNLTFLYIFILWKYVIIMAVQWYACVYWSRRGVLFLANEQGLSAGVSRLSKFVSFEFALRCLWLFNPFSEQCFTNDWFCFYFYLFWNTSFQVTQHAGPSVPQLLQFCA